MERWAMGEMKPTPRLLMGPGPSNVHYRVYQAMSTPVIGYLDPELLKCMDEISEMLKGLFQTKNRMTLAISATGSSGMEASFVNFVEPGDTVVIGVNGFFADRMTDVADRCGAKVIRIDQEWGKIVDPEKMIKAKPWEVASELEKELGLKVIAASDGMKLDLERDLKN